MMARKVMAGADGVPITSPLHPNKKAHYNMDTLTANVIVDSSVNGHDGTGSGLTLVSGLINNALDFDGGTDFATFPLAAFPSGSGQAYTVAGWVKFDTLASEQRFYSAAVPVTNFPKFRLRSLSDASLDLFLQTGTSTFIEITSAASALGTADFHLVGWTVDSSGNAELFLDTVSQGTETGVDNSFALDTHFLGTNRNNDGMRLNGQTDIWQLIDRVITADEWSAIYNGGAGAQA